MDVATKVRIACLRRHARNEIAALADSEPAEVEEHAREALAALLRARELEEHRVV